MFKSWTKAGRAEIRAERQRQADLDKTILGIAKLRHEYNQHWQYCKDRDLWESDWYKRISGIHEMTLKMLTNRFIQFGGKTYPYSIRGCASDSNYELDEKVAEKFGSDVQCGSEAGGLFIDATEAVGPEVVGFLSATDPEGDFDGEMDDPEDEFTTVRMELPFGATSDDVAIWLSEQGIVYGVDFSDAPGPAPQQITRGRSEIKTGLSLLYPEFDDDTLEGLVEYLVEEAANTVSIDLTQ